ncbi:MAG: HNH endonuclease [Caldimicrobium sp.]|nr:HNH endonuclease [Caldimicrobium sp.]MCX7874134.1 HNH endonuclease [Caldimicrobium sp.]MDW8093731.1 HNH endonuclease signature motif containing protein [Caldimicrobium sp.]
MGGRGETLTLEEHIKRERAKARALRKTRWWRRKVERGICFYCGKRVSPEELTMDHRLPLSQWGYSSRENIVPACKDCNTKKKYMAPWEWEEYIKALRGEGKLCVE